MDDEVLSFKVEVLSEEAKKELERLQKTLAETESQLASFEQQYQSIQRTSKNIGAWGNTAKKIKALTAIRDQQKSDIAKFYDGEYKKYKDAITKVNPQTSADSIYGTLTETTTTLKNDGEEVRKVFVKVENNVKTITTLLGDFVHQVREIKNVALGKEVTDIVGKQISEETNYEKKIQNIVTEYEEAGQKIKNFYKKDLETGILRLVDTKRVVEPLKNLGKEVTEGFSNIAIGQKIGQAEIISIDTNELENTKKIVTEILENGKRIKQTFTQDLTTGKLYEQSKKETKELEKQKKTLKTQFMERLKRIETYKIVSMLFRSIIKLFKEGFQYLSNYEALQDSLSGLKATTIGISTSIASLLTPALQALNVVLKPVSDILINLANIQSQNMAALKGQTQYYKISAHAIEDYAKSLQEANGQLTQLDKFATLQGNKPEIGKMVDINEDVSTDWLTGGINSITFDNLEELSKKLKEAQGIIDNIQAGFKKAGEIIEQFGAKGIISIIAVIGGLKLMTSLGIKLNSVFGIIGLAIGGIAVIATNTKPAIIALGAAMFGVAAAMLAFKIAANPLNAAIIGVVAAAGAFIAGMSKNWGMSAGSSPSTGNVSTPSYTNGYDYISGRMYNANETAMGNIERNTASTASGRSEAIVVNTEFNIDSTPFAKATTKAIAYEMKTGGYSV